MGNTQSNAQRRYFYAADHPQKRSKPIPKRMSIASPEEFAQHEFGALTTAPLQLYGRHATTLDYRRRSLATTSDYIVFQQTNTAQSAYNIDNYTLPTSNAGNLYQKNPKRDQCKLMRFNAANNRRISQIQRAKSLNDDALGLKCVFMSHCAVYHTKCI